MEVSLNPELEARLNEMALTTGRQRADIVQEALAGYLEDLAEVRDVLDRRYDEIISGKVTAIDGEEAFELLRKKTEARRNHLP
jgi:predicted DNA-binding protein